MFTITLLSLSLLRKHGSRPKSTDKSKMAEHVPTDYTDNRLVTIKGRTTKNVNQ